MIERAGDAALAALSSFGDADLTAAVGWIMQEPLDARAMELRRIIGQAAIEAMREPTDLMKDVTVPAGTAFPMRAYWSAMIDAALIWPAGSAGKAGVPMAVDKE